MTRSLLIVIGRRQSIIILLNSEWCGCDDYHYINIKMLIKNKVQFKKEVVNYHPISSLIDYVCYRIKLF
jgi:hypothetical protein